MNIKNLAKSAIRYDIPREKRCLGECRHRNYNYNGKHYCKIIGDYMDGNYTCPKYDEDYRYCEKYDTYCFIENQCLKCPIEPINEIAETFTEMVDDNKYDNGGYRR